HSSLTLNPRHHLVQEIEGLLVLGFDRSGPGRPLFDHEISERVRALRILGKSIGSVDEVPKCHLIGLPTG
ncbi:MAG TPA: hypothetical protein VFP10_12680, partial [Candidatus Eisenbacteria bacterium]|nr:hypothetical protein [Candidatus Eisenbacteria bacterium]